MGKFVNFIIFFDPFWLCAIFRCSAIKVDARSQVLMYGVTFDVVSGLMKG